MPTQHLNSLQTLLLDAEAIKGTGKADIQNYTGITLRAAVIPDFLLYM